MQVRLSRYLNKLSKWPYRQSRLSDRQPRLVANPEHSLEEGASTIPALKKIAFHCNNTLKARPHYVTWQNTTKCSLCRAANAENGVDINVAQFWHGFWCCGMLHNTMRHVAQYHVAWKFDPQSVGIIKGLPHWYLPSTVVRRNFWHDIWCVCASRSTIFVYWNMVAKKVFFNVDMINFSACVKQLLPHSKAIQYCILSRSIVWTHLNINQK